jgi:peroxiredoxin
MQPTILETQQSLASQLSAYKADFISRVDPKRVAMMEAATAKLRATGIESNALRVGNKAPDITLPNSSGDQQTLKALWMTGPVVVVFYRGGWCPYCNLELRAWQQHLPALQSLGASLVAISPQTPDNSLSTAEKNALSFKVLSDSALVAAKGFGIAFSLPPELINLYSSVGNNLPELNGNGQWILPVPATFVLDQAGMIRFAHIEADYRDRAEPSDVISVVRSLR